MSEPLLPTPLREMYESGMTQREIAEATGTTQKRVLLAMRRHGIPRRVAKRRNQELEANPTWKGETATYGAKHWRVYVRRGKASGWLCAVCEAKPAREWANLLGDYNDPQDYAPMCCSCHRRYDRAMRHDLDLSVALLGDWRSGSGGRGTWV